MNDAKKSDLITQLAGEFGLTGKPKAEESHYDRTTNTLFVGSRVYHYDDMENAKAYFKENKLRMKERKDNAETFFEIGEIAISMMMENSLGTGGRVVVKE